jgi:hypothetical protein
LAFNHTLHLLGGGLDVSNKSTGVLMLLCLNDDRDKPIGILSSIHDRRFSLGTIVFTCGSGACAFDMELRLAGGFNTPVCCCATTTLA